MPTILDSSLITGLLLAGGQGSRMGGVDKGMLPFRGQTLAQNALQRLAPQVGPLLVNANRNLKAYAAFGVPVCSDAEADFLGPLAGFLSGLDRCRTPYLATVPCDTPLFPLDMVARLARALQEANAEIAMVVTRDLSGKVQRQPVFCLLKRSVQASLEDYVVSGRRKIEAWACAQQCVEVLFEDAQAFANANTAEELQALESRQGGR